MRRPDIRRRDTRPVRVGDVAVGGGAPVSIQSMTTTTTADVDATLAQIAALAAAGADIVRVAAQTPADTAALRRIVPAAGVPIVADVHFHFRRALEAVAAGAHKIRLNPGNIADRSQVRDVIAACRDAGVPIRVGVNEGSVRKRGRESFSASSPAGKRGRGHDRPKTTPDPFFSLAELMVETLGGYLEVFDEAGFADLVLSAKSHDAATCIAVNRVLAERYEYPLHLGLTHAGTAETGLVRSVAAVGALLAEGIGDTIRISLSGDPLAEVAAARELLWSLRLRAREGVEIISCPTCGRTAADVAALAEQVRAATADVKAHLVVAVMGCVVNGPGEAAEADVAACCGKGQAAIYRAGERVGTVAPGEIVAALVRLVREAADDGGPQV